MFVRLSRIEYRDPTGRAKYLRYALEKDAYICGLPHILLPVCYAHHSCTSVYVLAVGETIYLFQHGRNTPNVISTFVVRDDRAILISESTPHTYSMILSDSCTYIDQYKTTEDGSVIAILNGYDRWFRVTILATGDVHVSDSYFMTPHSSGYSCHRYSPYDDQLDMFFRVEHTRKYGNHYLVISELGKTGGSPHKTYTITVPELGGDIINHIICDDGKVYILVANPHRSDRGRSTRVYKCDLRSGDILHTQHYERDAVRIAYLISGFYVVGHCTDNDKYYDIVDTNRQIVYNMTPSP